MPKDFAAMDTRGSTQTHQSMRGRLSPKAAHAARLEDLAPNPLNPRYSTDDSEIAGLANTMTVGSQYQAAVVIERKVFLEACPDQEEQLDAEAPNAKWVIVIGNRRHAAAKLAKITTLDIRVDSTIRTAEDIDRAMMVENIQRTALPPLPEARVLERMVSRPGASLRTVAEEIGKSHAYVQQRISLLNLIPEFQKLLQVDGLSIKTARKLAALNKQEQRVALDRGEPYLDEVKPSTPVVAHTAPLNAMPAAPQATPSVPSAAAPTPVAPTSGVNPVYSSTPPNDEPALSPAPAPAPASAPAPVNPVYSSEASDAEDTSDEQHPEPAGSFVAPAHDPAGLAQLIRQHLAPDEVAKLIEALLEDV